MQEDDLIIDTMEFDLTSTSRKKFILLSFIWMMSWLLFGTIVNASIGNRQLRPPPSRATLIEIHNHLGEEVHVLCTGWPQALGPNNGVIHETIPHGIVWYIDYGRDILQERLFCEIRDFERDWNCFLPFVIPNMCMWENPQLAVSRASIPSPESCPLCESRNIEGYIRCAWLINANGIYLSRRNLLANANTRELKATWSVSPEVFDKFAVKETFDLSFSNYFEDPVTLDCGERGSFHIRGYQKELGPRPRVWHWDVKVADRGRDSRWLCSIIVETSDGTRWTRNAIMLWKSPVGYTPEDGEREPPCIDCAWRLKDEGLWVNRRGCDDDRPQWEKRLSFA